MFLSGVVVFIVMYYRKPFKKLSNVLWAVIHTVVAAIVVSIVIYLNQPDFNWNKIIEKGWILGLYFLVMIYALQSVSKSED
jgi:uncharacterized membrane protein